MVIRHDGAEEVGEAAGVRLWAENLAVKKGCLEVETAYISLVVY